MDTANRRRPVRTVLIGSALLSALFAATAPWVDLPAASYVAAGALYSVLLVTISVGVSLLSGRAAAWAWGVITATGLLAMVWLLVLAFLPLSFPAIGPLIAASYTFAAMALLVVIAASLCGWIRFFARR